MFARPVADSEGETLVPEAESPAPGPEKLAELAQAKSCIDGCLGKLGTLHREVLSLRITGPEQAQFVKQMLTVGDTVVASNPRIK